MNAGDAVWGGLILAGAAVETYALRTARQEDTLSAATRRWFRVHTKAGAFVFVGGWVAFSVWWIRHIVG
ncbi:hypothetical protein EF919_18065 [Streptomyces sp. WAC02707]|uniref:hypothetical protein n=1 Tax=Streptomyces TaxID=1883 RepID=UPI000F79F970|nr:hypothetical protein [Streptomyces sp. WAC02707]RSS92440.1 hypothetical protein EF919_18065 [Streptomyces sp. WAC02707]